MELSAGVILAHGDHPQWRVKKVTCRPDCATEHFSVEAIDGSIGFIGALPEIIGFAESLARAASRQAEIMAMS